MNGRKAALGNRALLAELGISPGATRRARRESARIRRTNGRVRGYCRRGRSALGLIGLIGIADPIKASASDAIAHLHSEGIRIVMLTGDARATAETVARALGIDEVHAGVLPDQKGAMVKKLQSEGRIVAMAGDGVNDAPALAQADVGIAMGSGTDVAMASAGITLLGGDLRNIVRARTLSRATMRNIRQNLFFAFVYNALRHVPVAAGVLYPFSWIAAQPDLRLRGHDVQLGFGDCQRAALAPSQAVAVLDFEFGFRSGLVSRRAPFLLLPMRSAWGL